MELHAWPCAQGNRPIPMAKEDVSGQRGPTIKAREVRAQKEGNCVAPALRRRAHGAPARQLQSWRQRERAQPLVEPQHPDTTHIEACGGRRYRQLRLVGSASRQKPNRYHPSPTAALRGPQWQHPWRARTTPAPGGPVCAIGAGCAATWAGLSSKAQCWCQWLLQKCLTHVKEHIRSSSQDGCVLQYQSEFSPCRIWTLLPFKPS